MQDFFNHSNFAGRDGFYWWIGQIETKRGTQKKEYDVQYKVRIVGHHLSNCNAVPSEDLPWAIVMMPAIAPRRPGNTDGQSIKYDSGDWVIGFFLDGNEGQHPVIMGSLPLQHNATNNTTKTFLNPDSTCNAFNTPIPSDIHPQSDLSTNTWDLIKNSEFKGFTQLNLIPNGGSLPNYSLNIGGGDAAIPTGTGAAVVSGGNALATNSNPNASKLQNATKTCSTDLNPFSPFFCIAVSDAKCIEESSFQSSIQQILTELFANISNNGGSFKNGILSPFTGQIYDFVAIAQGYINKINTLISSSLTRVKGEIYALIKQGTNEILDFLLTDKAVDTDATNEQQKILAGLRSSQISNNLNAVAKSTINTISFAGSSLFPSDSTISTNSSFTDATSFVLADGTSFGPPPVMKKVGRLAPLTQWINQQLEQVGCKMEDLDKRLRDYLTNKIFAYINKAFTAATCMIDGIVQDIINDINSFLDIALKDILGPLQQLLGVSGSSTNILGTVLEKISSLLGITCGGPTSSCLSSEQKNNCTGPCGSETNTNFLDNLITSVEQGNFTNPSDSCSDIYQVPSAANTVISVIGGAPDSTAFTGSTTNIVASTPTDPISDAINTLFPIIPLTPIIVSPPVTLLNVKYAGKSNLSITNYATTSSFIVFSIAL